MDPTDWLHVCYEVRWFPPHASAPTSRAYSYLEDAKELHKKLSSDGMTPGIFRVQRYTKEPNQ